MKEILLPGIDINDPLLSYAAIKPRKHHAWKKLENRLATRLPAPTISGLILSSLSIELGYTSALTTMALQELLFWTQRSLFWDKKKK